MNKLEVAQILENESGKRRGKCLIGWDGNTDELIDVVEMRHGADDYKAMTSIQTLGERITRAAGKSCNIELIPQKQKIGGNGPILCRALLEGEHDITLLGCVGKEEVEPLFKELELRCQKVYSFGPSAYTQALEFSDGKVMFGKLEVFKKINWDNLLKLVSLEQLIEMHNELDLFVSANWTMLLGIHTIWQGIIDHVLPRLKKKTRWMFVDLADPAKRTDEDLLQCLDLLSKLNAGYNVVLGLNQSEEGRVARTLGLYREGSDKEDVGGMAQDIVQKVGLTMVVCHSSRYTVAATSEAVATVDVPLCKEPVIMTGAGDNFNAGFCNGLIHGLDPEGCLLSGVGGSGFYVRNGHSPTMKELAEFIRLWHANQV